jgi:hypothetical protein
LIYSLCTTASSYKKVENKITVLNKGAAAAAAFQFYNWLVVHQSLLTYCKGYSVSFRHNNNPSPHHSKVVSCHNHCHCRCVVKAHVAWLQVLVCFGACAGADAGAGDLQRGASAGAGTGAEMRVQVGTQVQVQVQVRVQVQVQVQGAGTGAGAGAGAGAEVQGAGAFLACNTCSSSVGNSVGGVSPGNCGLFPSRFYETLLPLHFLRRLFCLRTHMALPPHSLRWSLLLHAGKVMVLIATSCG